MKPAKDPRKHHFVPKFYLESWVSSEDHQLEEFKRNYGGQIVSRRWGPGGTGFKKDLYAMPGVPKAERQIVERTFMSMVDTTAADAYRELLQGRIPQTLKGRVAWARFMLSLLIRNPDEISAFKQFVSKSWTRPRPEVQAKYVLFKKPGDPDSAGEFLLNKDPTMPLRTAILSATNTITNPTILDGFLKMQWHVADLSSLTTRLLTSDRPLYMTDGISRPDGHMFLPLSPTHLFVAASYSSGMDKITRAPRSKLLRTSNMAVVQQAQEWVYAVDNSQIGLIRREMSKMKQVSLIRRILADDADEAATTV
ncbi:hypothetical protein X769_07620 [Mesorhizobium sp. LSJC268A00]|uniref:DUF4238 domain-containing protein n=1 Tax=unclassified Mesorhizobium TaxID=325217 RepID=UPI0003CEDB3C|nr:DUF4238 domain-containing protein [Mesorhizobium sp. LSJC268A00]ESX07227.1 hypothetical protein X769_07620 [Mesorhizobium sp. LSJC268A00]